MQPLKLSLEGAYYDTQIYSGRLYLWCHDSSIRVIDWDLLIELLEERNPSSKFSLECGFRQSQYLYGAYWQLFFNQPEIKQFILESFSSLAANPIFVSEEILKQVEIKHQDNPMPFPHSDSVIYNNHLFTGSKLGIYGSSCKKKNKYPVSTRPNKLSDIPCLSVAASYNSLAVSAGQEGLLEIELGRYYYWASYGKDYYVLSTNHSSSSSWAFYSIFSSSYVGFGYLAEFTRYDQYDEPQEPGEDIYSVNEDRRGQYHIRKLNRVIPDQELFHSIGNSFSWGRQDKLCKVNNNIISVLQYSPWSKDEKYTHLGDLHLREYKGNVVSGDSALFGFIIECDNGIVVMDSNLKNVWLPGEPINWRVFPRSKFYENHLHIVYKDRLEILSFNDDYFVDQEKKKAGIRYWESSKSWNR